MDQEPSSPDVVRDKQQGLRIRQLTLTTATVYFERTANLRTFRTDATVADGRLYDRDGARVVPRQSPAVAVAASPEFLDLDDGWPVLRAALVGEGLYPLVVTWGDSKVDSPEGNPLVLEVELVEPSLFLPAEGAAAAKLAHCLSRLIREIS